MSPVQLKYKTDQVSEDLSQTRYFGFLVCMVNTFKNKHGSHDKYIESIYVKEQISNYYTKNKHIKQLKIHSI